MSLEDLGFTFLCKSEAPSPRDTSGAATASPASFLWKMVLPFLVLGGMAAVVDSGEKKLDADALEQALYHLNRGDRRKAVETIYARLYPSLERVMKKQYGGEAVAGEAINEAFVPGGEVEKLLDRVASGEVKEDKFKTTLLGSIKNIQRSIERPVRPKAGKRTIFTREDLTDEEAAKALMGEEVAGLSSEEARAFAIAPIVKQEVDPSNPKKKISVTYVPQVVRDKEGRPVVEAVVGKGTFMLVDFVSDTGKTERLSVLRPKVDVQRVQVTEMPVVLGEGGAFEVPIEDIRALASFESEIELGKIKNMLDKLGVSPEVYEAFAAKAVSDYEARPYKEDEKWKRHRDAEKRRLKAKAEGGDEDDVQERLRDESKALRDKALADLEARYGYSHNEAKERYEEQVERIKRIIREIPEEGDLTAAQIEDFKRYLTRTDDLMRQQKIVEDEAFEAESRGDDETYQRLYRRAEEIGDALQNMSSYHLWVSSRREFERRMREAELKAAQLRSMARLEARLRSAGDGSYDLVLPKDVKEKLAAAERYEDEARQYKNRIMSFEVSGAGVLGYTREEDIAKKAIEREESFRLLPFMRKIGGIFNIDLARGREVDPQKVIEKLVAKNALLDNALTAVEKAEVQYRLAQGELQQIQADLLEKKPKPGRKRALSGATKAFEKAQSTLASLNSRSQKIAQEIAAILAAVPAEAVEEARQIESRFEEGRKRRAEQRTFASTGAVGQVSEVEVFKARPSKTEKA